MSDWEFLRESGAFSVTYKGNRIIQAHNINGKTILYIAGPSNDSHGGYNFKNKDERYSETAWIGWYEFDFNGKKECDEGVKREIKQKIDELTALYDKL